MEFRVLGPLEVWDAGAELAVHGRARAVLALLLVDAGRVVSSDRLIDELWGERAPASAANMLQGYVSDLRKALTGTGTADRLLVTRPPGYSLRIEPAQVDASRFEQLVREAERFFESGAVQAAHESLSKALGLWRGHAFADVPSSPGIDAEIARLDELRLTATERRSEAALALDRVGEATAELERLVREHPYRERLREHLMLALYRGGRQADALDVYRDGRRRLVEDMGIEPGARLQVLQRAILSHDRSLDRPVESAPDEGSRPRRLTRRKLLGSVAVGAAAAAAGLAASRRGDGAAEETPAVRVRPHSVAIVDPETNSVVRNVAVGQWPGAVAAGAGSVWVANSGADTISRIDPRTMLATDAIPGTTPIDLAVRDGIIWIANGNSVDGPTPPGGGTIERYDASTEVLKATRVGPAVLGNAEQTVVAAGEEGVWAANRDAARLYRLDARTGRVRATARATIQAGGIAVGAGSVWVTDTVNDQLFRIEPDTARVVARITVSNGPTRVAVGDGGVWVVGRFPQSGVWRIDPETNRPVGYVEVPNRAARLAVGSGDVWVTSGALGEPGPGYVTRIDAETNRIVASIELGSGLRPDGVALASGFVWFAVAPP